MPTASTWTRAACDALAAVLLAPVCAACRAPLEHPASGPICGACWETIPPVPAPCCVACGDSLPSWRASAPFWNRCARCHAATTGISRTRAVGAYDGSLRAIIHALKFDRRRSVAAPLGALMRTRGVDVLDGADFAVPVPLHPWRHAVRGFNQASELARPLQLPVVRALRRIRYTRPQAELPAERRGSNIRGAFRVRRAADVRGACVVVVDDVSTTGATLEACAQALREGGARDVRALIAARAVARGRPAPPW